MTAAVLPSHMRVVPGSVNLPITPLPQASKTHVESPESVASDTISKINTALERGDTAALLDLFAPGGFWRDHLALTWDFRTVNGNDGLSAFFEQCKDTKDGFRLTSVALDKSSPARVPQLTSLDGAGEVPCLVFFLTLETKVGQGEGVARLVQHGGFWKIYTIYTALRQLKGHDQAINHGRPHGVDHGGRPGRKNWAERRTEEVEYYEKDPAVIILGAGQAGLSIAARLKVLGVNSLIVDQNEKVGDNWRKRYHQLVLHDPVWYDHLPYIKFPPQWPIFTPKDKLAGFFESYAKLLELDIWMRTTITDVKWNEREGSWAVTVDRQGEDGKTTSRTLRPHHIIQATGHSGKMALPSIQGMDAFQGHLLCHSSQFPGAREGSKGARAVVVGSCNSGHDIAQDFLEKGYHVTMVQRSSTCVISSESITEIGLKALYSETSPAVEDADLLNYSMPSKLYKGLQVSVTQAQNESDKKTLEGLRRAGFQVDMGPDDAGLTIKYFQRGGGYYIDVGASKLIIDGKIKVKHGELAEVLPRGLRFTDGSEVEADEIVFATGYQNMRTQTRQIFGDKIADRVGDVWGFNEEGEMRSIWQQSGHPGFWYHGGNLALCRYYSLLLALQIKGLEEGVYGYGDK
ncbi:hypothetical protein F5X68DRAFT_264412 [Plectosphaerella plurivora]|uniref:Flavin-containing monooxygenase n=1 Tax=Plectosphaerella plurivora TaxID=936078 RepID=A0A9P9A5A1_9PEZI|nr:hypothetical protein F5X68DRAFT_264412 [Plectosphaerella plurivora]